MRGVKGVKAEVLEWDTDSTFLLSGYAWYWNSLPFLKYDLFLSKFDADFNLLWETTVYD